MTKLSKVMRILALAAVVAVGSVVQAAAAPIVSVSPAAQQVPQGPVSVDILVSGLGATEEVGAFSLVLSFNSAILSGVGYTPDPDAKMGAGFDLSGGFAGGTLDLFYAAEDFAPAGPGPEDDAALKALQGTGFRLARINFLAIADGVSPLNLSVVGAGGAFLSDAQGFVLPSTAVNGQVCVGGPCPSPVPEPGLLALMGAGLGALVARRRAAARARA